MFRGTVFENICNGLVGDQRDLSSEEKMALVREACISSNADAFIQELPNVCISHGIRSSTSTLTINRVTIQKLVSEQVCFLVVKGNVSPLLVA